MKRIFQMRSSIRKSVRLAAVAFALLCAREAAADWLFWTVDFENALDNEGVMQDNPAPGWKGSQVWLVAQKGDEKQYVADVNGKIVYTMTENYPASQDWMGKVAQVDFSQFDNGYSFFVEMGLANSGSYNGYYLSDTFTYDDLVSAGHVSASLEAVDVVWNPAVGAEGGPWQAPEPSGGLLTLVGTAILMLRRRRLHLNSGSGRQA